MIFFKRVNFRKLMYFLSYLTPVLISFIINQEVDFREGFEILASLTNHLLVCSQIFIEYLLHATQTARC